MSRKSIQTFELNTMLGLRPNSEYNDHSYINLKNDTASMEKNEPGDRYNRYETVRLRSGLQQDNIVTGTVIAHKLRS